MEPTSRTLKSVITTTQHLLEIKVKKKAMNSQIHLRLKENKILHKLKCHMTFRARPYVCGSKKCSLYLTEKLTIIKADPESLLNTSDELVSKGRHMSKFTLKCFKED